MQTPYSSFANTNKFFSKEYPIPTSAFCTITEEDMEYFLGLNSEDISKITNTISQGTAAYKAVSGAVQGATSKQMQVNVPPPAPVPQKSGTNAYAIIGIGGGLLLVAAVVIVYFKNR
jgi:hypothetical protein